MEPSRVRLCRAPRQHRGHLQEARRTARHGRCDGRAQGAAPDRQRGNPQQQRRATIRPRVEVLRPEPDRLGEAARRVRKEGASARHGAAGHPASRRGQAGADARTEPVCGWTTTGNTRRSSPTTTARKTASPSKRRSPSWSSLPTASTPSSAAPPKKGLSDDELALFDLLKKDNLSKADRERVKLASQSLLDSVRRLIAPLERWTEKEQTQAEVEVIYS